MKFFEELMDATSKLADQAVKVGKEAFDQGKVIANEAMDKGKKKMNQLSLESNMKDAYRKLGELVYTLHKAGETNEELINQYIEEISAIEKELELLEADFADDYVNEEADFTLEDVKEETIEIVDDIVEEVKEVFSADKKVCPGCGAEAGDTDIFCRECGSKLGE